MFAVLDSGWCSRRGGGLGSLGGGGGGRGDRWWGSCRWLGSVGGGVARWGSCRWLDSFNCGIGCRRSSCRRRLSLCSALGVRVFDADAGAGHLEDHGVVDEAVDGGRGGHRIFEDPVPLAEDEIAGD